MPIDQNFMKKPSAGEHNGHKVRGVVKPPKKLGVHGTNVAVDHDSCNGDGVCLSVCPMNVFDWTETPGHSLSDKKSDPAREKDCIQCMACEASCPQKAIKITKP